MAEFKGRQCDSCGKVMAAEDAIKYTQRFEGGGFDGQRTLDLCETCIEPFDLTDLKPIRRRGQQDEGPKVKDGDTPSQPAAVAGATP